MRVHRLIVLVLCCLLAWSSVGALAQEPAPAPPPASVEELLKLLQDPQVVAWLGQAQAAVAAGAPASPAEDEQQVGQDLSQRLDRARRHLQAIVAAVPRFPQEAGHAVDELLRERQEHAPGSTLALFALFLAIGVGAEVLFRRALLGRREVSELAGPDASVQRAGADALRLLVALLSVGVFALASIGPFLLVEWPPLLKELILNVLAIIVVVRLALVVLRAVFATGRKNAVDAEGVDSEVSARDADFWYRHTAAFVCYLLVGTILVQMMDSLGFSPDVRQLAAYILALGLLAIGLAAVWRRPARRGNASAPRWRRAAFSVLLTVYVLGVWLLWVAGLRGLFWLALLAFLLPRVIGFARATISRLLTPADAAAPPEVRRALLEVTVDRGVRALLIVAAVMWLAHVADVDVAGLTREETPLSRLFGGLLTAVVVFLIADFAWQLIKAGFNAKLAQALPNAEPGSPEAIREARLRTLIPIFRNVILIVIVVFAVLMALAGLGVQIGPLVAGAGVIGVAVGFGAQNLVKDIISGMFYLVDDAFRVGEYIQSGSYKGTVEGFSLRSIRLRHQNGPVFVIPFSELGAVENMSRDWVITKFSVGITYDSDFEKARKLIKQIGQDLSQDPSFAHNILEPLKMQGVDQLGDFAVVLRCKMKTRPGEQFVIRRKALAMIKKSFDENGIKFAFPTVQVAGGGEAAPAAIAHEALELVRPAAAS